MKKTMTTEKLVIVFLLVELAGSLPLESSWQML
jgi:hypothetical protein